MSAPALGQNATAGGYGTSFTTSAVTTQATGSAFIALILSNGTGTSQINTPTDSFSNTYTLVTTGSYTDDASTQYYAIYKCLGGTGGSGHTLSVSEASGNSMVASFVEITNASSLDTLPASTSNTNNTSCNAPAITPSAADAYILSFIAGLGDKTFSGPTDSFAIVNQQESGDGQMCACALGLAVSATGTYQTTVTASAALGWVGNTLAFTSGVPSGTAAITEGADTVAASGNVSVTGTASIAEASDTVAGTGTISVAGSASITEGADAAAGTGAIGISASGAAGEGADAAAGTGAVAVSGTGAAAEGADVASGAGTVGSAISGSGAANEGADAAAGAGSVSVAGSGAPPEGADAAAGAGGVAVAAAGAAAEAADAASAAGGVAIAGAGAAAESADVAHGVGVISGAGLGAPGSVPSSPLYTIRRQLARNFSVWRDQRRIFAVHRIRVRVFEVNSVSLRFPVKGPAESVPLTFDFSADLPSGVTLTGAPTLSIECTEGVDANAANVIAGAKAFNAANTGVVQDAAGGVDGCEYTITCTSPTTQANLTLSLVGILPVRANLN